MVFSSQWPPKVATEPAETFGFVWLSRCIRAQSLTFPVVTHPANELFGVEREQPKLTFNTTHSKLTTTTMGEKSKSAKKKTESPKSTKKVQQTLPIRSKETIEDSDAMISSSEDDAEESSDEEDEQPKAKDTVASTPA